jgi:PhnB protein
MPTKGQPVPQGYHTVTPHLTIRDASKAIEFYKQAFGARELHRMPGPDGKSIMHAALQIGDSILMLNDECPEAGGASPQRLNGTPVTLHLYVDKVDQLFERAVKAGAKVMMPLSDMFWGDRYGKLQDPFGHQWSLATHQYEFTPEEMQKGAAQAFAQMPKGSK